MFWPVVAIFRETVAKEYVLI